jgi:hypothetical protein
MGGTKGENGHPETKHAKSPPRAWRRLVHTRIQLDVRRGYPVKLVWYSVPGWICWIFRVTLTRGRVRTVCVLMTTKNAVDRSNAALLVSGFRESCASDPLDENAQSVPSVDFAPCGAPQT